jgi:hypothetical protein
MEELGRGKRELGKYVLLLSTVGELHGLTSAESNRYSSARMEEILAGFRELAGFSADLGRELSETMRAAMESGGATSLASIAKESMAISSDLGAFFRDLDSLRAFSSEIMTATSAQLEKLRAAAEGIEGFAETIRIISMNVNIQAARLLSSAQGQGAKGTGRSFQVLSRNLSDFAEKAQELARGQRRCIEGAARTLTDVDARFIASLETLVARVPAVRARMDPFALIIQDSFKELAQVVTALEGLASSVDGRLKAILGLLQFHDLTRQEIEHSVAFLSSALSLQGDFGLDEETRRGITEGEVEDLRRRAVDMFRGLCTTVNERRVLETYQGGPGVQGPGQESDEPLTDGSIRMF